MNNSNRDFDKLNNYFIKNGGYHNFNIIKFKNEFGIELKSDSKKGEVVAVCPNNLLIKSRGEFISDLKNNSKEKKLFDDNETNIIYNCKSLSLLLSIVIPDKEKKDLVSLLLGSLPYNLSNFPLYWNNENLKILKNTFFYDDLKLLKNEIHKYYILIKNKLNIRYKFFKYLFQIISSRSFCLSQNEICLAPIVDLINHSVNYNCEYFVRDSKLFFTLNKDCKKGEIITINYGDKNDRRYLLSYGFNPNYNNEIIVFSKIDNQYWNLKSFTKGKDLKALYKKLSKYDKTLEEDLDDLDKLDDNEFLKRMAYDIIINEKRTIINLVNEL